MHNSLDLMYMQTRKISGTTAHLSIQWVMAILPIRNVKCISACICVGHNIRAPGISCTCIKEHKVLYRIHEITIKLNTKEMVLMIFLIAVLIATSISGLPAYVLCTRGFQYKLLRDSSVLYGLHGGFFVLT